MRFKFTIQQLSTTPDGAGGATGSWSVMKTLFADVQIVSSGRLFVEGQEYAGTFYSITCRAKSFQYVAPVENYRLILDPDGQKISLKILALSNPDLLQRFLTITAVNNG